jgi:MFS family permease
MFLATFVGYGQMEAGFPAFARQVSEVSTRVVGFAFALNTVVIVALQFLVLGRITGRRRTRVLLVMAALWAGAWAVLGATGLVPGTAVAAVGVLLFHGAFALGETLLQPTIPAITNDLAPDHLRGRYNAVSAAAFQAGTIAGPVVAGLMLGHGWSRSFVGLLVAGCAAMAVLALALERRISGEVNGLQESPSGLEDTVPPEGRPVTS